MRVPLLSSILAALVTVAVGSVANPDTDALRNVERQTPVQVCVTCLSSGTTCLVSVPTLCCSGVCTQTSNDVPEVGTCAVSRWLAKTYMMLFSS
ncbi:hypothetical protein EV401DRAFT_1925721 [Pisolithus croceorrhizus]|nr:hypothetical protein EV401DRAFT_1925721 [Pisolithus croceorrhizus]